MVAMDKNGNFGSASNIEGFSFVVANENLEPTVYLVKHDENGKSYHEKASQEWIDNYLSSRMAPISEDE